MILLAEDNLKNPILFSLSKSMSLKGKKKEYAWMTCYFEIYHYLDIYMYVDIYSYLELDFVFSMHKIVLLHLL